MSSQCVVEKDFFFWRLTSAVFWNGCIQLTLLLTFTFLVNINIIHPVLWMQTTLEQVISIKSIVGLLPLTLLIVFQGFISAKYYSVGPPKYTTRFSMFLNILSVQNIVMSVTYALSGFLTISLYSSFVDNNFKSVSKLCSTFEGNCLNEYYIFIKLGGLWIGLYYFLRKHIFGSTAIIFPHIEQKKFIQMKTAIFPVITMAFKDSIVPVLYYTIIYCIWGYHPRQLAMEIYNLYSEEEPLYHIFAMIFSGIIVYLWIFASLFTMTMYVMCTIFNIVLTEHVEFPITPMENSLSLSQALCQDVDFVKLLAAQDLMIMSIHDKARRKEVFNLSQPGGHPVNWQNLIAPCYKIINWFNNELESINNNVKVNNASLLVDNKIPSSYNPFVPKIRNMAETSPISTRTQAVETPTINFKEALRLEFNMFLQRLCQKPGISYFFGELIECRLRLLMAQALPVMWVCQGLAFITSASLTEDCYGVCQNDLPNIITVLIKLKQNLERLSKLGLVPRKSLMTDIFTIQMKSALTLAVKRSLYKITHTYGPFMNDVALSAEIRAAIQPFTIFREG